MNKYEITSENSSNHWAFTNTTGKNVLDIGCGIWTTNEFNETSPVYFGKTANLVVGVDASSGCIDTYKQHFLEDSKYIFNCMSINNVDQVRRLISEHNIDFIKCDIEGHEKVLLELTSSDLINVTDFAVEFHTHELEQAFLDKIPNEWGYTIDTIASFCQTPDNLGVIYGVK